MSKEEMKNNEAVHGNGAKENAESTAKTETHESGDADNNASEEDAALGQLKAAQGQIDMLKDKYLRAVAEFDNYKKRTLKEKAELLLNGSEKTVCAVLPILDDFERALANNTDDAKAMKDGMQIIFNKFTKVLESLGVKKIETEGKDFDVDFHEAVAMVPGMGDDKKGKVIDCLQTGYQLNDKVIRHAKVAVGQ